jgi:hypothetical protein
MKGKLKEGLIKINEKEVIEMVNKNGSGTLKNNLNQLENLLDENGELKPDETKKFIDSGSFTNVLKSLNQWAELKNVQRD